MPAPANPRIYYDNRLAENGGPAASSTAAGNYAAANVTDWRAYTFWQPGVLPATLTSNSGLAKAADFALVYGHNMKSVGATLEVRGSIDNFGASDNLVAAYAPASDDPFVVSFGSIAYQYWRLKFIGATPPTIAIAAIGAALEFPVGLDQAFDPLGREINGQQNDNENGHPLGRVVYFEEWNQDLTFTKVPWSWIRQTFVPTWRSYLRGTPFVFGWEVVNQPTELVLVKAGMKWSTPHYSGSVADLQLNMSGVIN